MPCLIDESGSLSVASPGPFRVGFLFTGHPERLESHIRTLGDWRLGDRTRISTVNAVLFCIIDQSLYVFILGVKQGMRHAHDKAPIFAAYLNEFLGIFLDVLN